MGVFLCIGVPIYTMKPEDAKQFSEFNNFGSIQDYIEKNKSIFVCLGKDIHKVKKKAEQGACQQALDILNKYLLSIMETHLNIKEYDVLRMSYGLDCDKMSAKQIAGKLQIEGTASYVRISQIKRDAINKLIETVDPAQVADLL